MQIYGTSTSSYGKKVSSTYQKRHGSRWFQATASFSLEKLVVVQRTRTYAVQHACGTFLPNSLYLPALFAKALEGGASALSLLLTGCQWFHTVSNFSFMKDSKFRSVHGRTFLNNGIHATFGSKAIMQPH